MLVLAHRGLHHHVAENTIASFDAAVAAGVDGFETDVRATRDKVAVLFHDPSIRRKKVARLTREELSHAARHEVASLEEAVARFDVFWNVEIKSADAVAPTLRVLRAFKKTRRFLVTSFRPDVVARVHRAGFDCGRIVARAPVRGRRNAGKVFVIQYRLLNASRVKRVHRAGFRIYVYGPRTPSEHARCAGMGIEGVITDWPDRAGRKAGGG
jgi:glycerophosphoryl diester phosphodiesterase